MTSPGTIAWLVEQAPVSDDAMPAISGVTDADALLQALLAAGHLPDALKLLAVALPPREGAWWAWAAASHAARISGEKGESPAVVEALAATERWIAAPDDEARRAAWAASERAGLDTPAGCAAAVPYFATGSIAPPEIAPIPAPPGLHAKMVATCVILSAVADSAHFEALARAYVAQGLEVLAQAGGWDRSVELARSHVEAQGEAHRKVMAPAGTSPSAAR